MNRPTCLLWSPLALGLAALPARASDADLLQRLQRAARTDSHVMATASMLCDVIGPRLTGSPQARRASAFTREQLADWGLANAHLESWHFGRGWSVEHTAVHLIAPERATLVATPKAWTVGTRGAVRGEAIHVVAASEDDLRPWRGLLSKKIVFLGDPRPSQPPDCRPRRLSDDDLAQLRTPAPPPAPPDPRHHQARARFRQQLALFLEREGVLAVVEPGDRDGGAHLVVRPQDVIHLTRAGGLPALQMTSEHFGRVVRLLARGATVRLELDVRTAFHDDDPTSANTLADLPGSDLRDEIVMVGAHLDSWHGATGATDNAAGVAIAMEAMRLLKLLDARPRRTIRLALWTGEEQGLLGSRAYAAEHLGRRAEPKDELVRALPFFMRPFEGVLDCKPAHARFVAYFNVDHGSGRIRGVYLQGATHAAPLLGRWLAPLAELGVTLLSPRSLIGSDHQTFESLGLPAFPFVHDDLGYLAHTHHTNMDVFERLEPDDLIQASIATAWVAYQAATSVERLPRTPTPPQTPSPPDASH